MTMRVSRLLWMLFAVLLTAGVPGTFALAQGEPEPQEDSRWIQSQLNPKVPLASLFPQASHIAVGAAIMPDPRVPRYRRLYDLAIVAIELGMLEDGYVLDRFSLPWVEPDADQRKQAETEQPRQKDVDQKRQRRKEEPYGLLVFRCDTWRSGECAGKHEADEHSRIRALYVLTDTATYGVKPAPLRDVVKMIGSQLTGGAADEPKPEKGGDPAAKVDLLSYPYTACSDPKTLVVLGPTFSGALDSIGEQSATSIAPQIDHLCVVSSSTTNPTNAEIGLQYKNVHYVELPLNDRMKLEHVARLAEQLLGLDPMTPASKREFSGITILAESSTFGYGVCDQFRERDQKTRKDPDFNSAKRLCDEALKLYFPSSIADIRVGIQRQEQEKERGGHNPLKLPSADDTQLALDMGTENGSEYPESQQYASTSASKQLALEQLLDSMKATSDPRIVLVIATDVRDRLFLFDELRERFPRTMLIDLSSDNLLAHPDFLHATRGALSFGSTTLLLERTAEQREMDVFGCRSPPDAARPQSNPPWASWSTDYQAMLADSITRLQDGDRAGGWSPCFLPDVRRRATLQLVTLEGLFQVSQSGLQNNRAAPSILDPFPAYPVLGPLLLLSVAGAPLFCIVIMFTWMSPLNLASRRVQALGAAGTGTLVACVFVTYAVLTLLLTGDLRKIDHDNPLVFWTATTWLVGTWGLLRCRQLIRDARPASLQSRRSQDWIPAIPALGAILIAATPLWWEYQQAVPQHASIPLLDSTLMMKLALDPDPGVAFFLVTAVATVALLYLSLVLATAISTLRRNSQLLARSAVNARSSNSREFFEDSLPKELRSHLLPAPLLLFCALGLVAAMTLPDLLEVGGSGVRLTLFGLDASRAALAALTATTMSALVAIFVALRIGLRVMSIAGYLRNAFLDAKRKASGKASIQGLGPWPPGPYTPPSFPATPVISRAVQASTAMQSLYSRDGFTEWARLLTDWLHKGADDSQRRAAVFVLLATEVSLYRWLLACAVLCALASVAIVYLFPIESDMLLVLNLIIFIASGVVAGYMATAYERNGVMSRILCDRPRKAKLSTALFAFVAAPFAALAIAIAVAQVPGVVDWSGGLIALMEGLGLHP
jgi:hypothetical protein